jgi:predicted DCC family thiol-disulfide oxidoreductase YuxK
MTTVIYDGDCGLCTRVKQTVEALDWLGTMRWIPSHTAEAKRFGIAPEQLQQAVYLVSGNGQSSGFAAVQGMLTRLPLTYFVLAFVIAKKPWTALAFAFLFSPLSNPIGQPAYDWVARNRYRIAGSTCDNRIK